MHVPPVAHVTVSVMECDVVVKDPDEYVIV